MRKVRARALAGAAVTCLSLITTAQAQAGLLTATASGCPAVSMSQPFASLGDDTSYFPVPGGDFESGASGWTLRNAAVADGNDPFLAGSHNLQIAAGGSASSPVVCVGADDPSIRFAARNRGGLLSALAVSVRFVGPLGLTLQAPIGIVTGGSSWKAPSALVVANLLTAADGTQTPVQFVFSAAGGGWGVDDVYVDPYRKG